MHEIIPVEEAIVEQNGKQYLIVAQGPDDFDLEEIEDGEGTLRLYRHA